MGYEFCVLVRLIPPLLTTFFVKKVLSVIGDLLFLLESL